MPKPRIHMPEYEEEVFLKCPHCLYPAPLFRRTYPFPSMPESVVEGESEEESYSCRICLNTYDSWRKDAVIRRLNFAMNLQLDLAGAFEGLPSTRVEPDEESKEITALIEQAKQLQE